MAGRIPLKNNSASKKICPIISLNCIGLQTIGDGDDVGGDVSRHVATLSFNDGKGSQTSSPEFIVHLRRTLKKTRVKIKHTTISKSHLDVGLYSPG